LTDLSNDKIGRWFFLMPVSAGSTDYQATLDIYAGTYRLTYRNDATTVPINGRQVLDENFVASGMAVSRTYDVSTVNVSGAITLNQQPVSGACPSTPGYVSFYRTRDDRAHFFRAKITCSSGVWTYAGTIPRGIYHARIEADTSGALSFADLPNPRPWFSDLTISGSQALNFDLAATIVQGHVTGDQLSPTDCYSTTKFWWMSGSEKSPEIKAQCATDPWAYRSVLTPGPNRFVFLTPWVGTTRFGWSYIDAPRSLLPGNSSLDVSFEAVPFEIAVNAIGHRQLECPASSSVEFALGNGVGLIHATRLRCEGQVTVVNGLAPPGDYIFGYKDGSSPYRSVDPVSIRAPATSVSLIVPMRTVRGVIVVDRAAFAPCDSVVGNEVVFTERTTQTPYWANVSCSDWSFSIKVPPGAYRVVYRPGQFSWGAYPDRVLVEALRVQ
jgi:hypothetical protein